MRVLHLTRDFPPPNTGGLSTAVSGMARAIAAEGVASSVLSFDRWRPSGEGARRSRLAALTDGGCSVLRIEAVAQLERALPYARAERPDVLLLHDALLWPYARSIAAALALPIAFMPHVLQAEQNRLRGLALDTASARAETSALAGAAAVLAPSQAAAEILLAADAGLVDKIRVTKLGSALSPEPVGMSGDKTADLLYAGRFSDLNGIDDFIGALPALFEAHPELTIDIAGGQPIQLAGERRWRKRIAAGLPAEAARSLRFLGWLPRDELSVAYRAARVLVVPSRFETFGQVALEGMLHGCAIAASAVGALVELFGEPPCARLSPPVDPTSLADGIIQLLSDSALAQELGAQARTRAESTYLWNLRAPDIVAALYFSVCGEPSRPGRASVSYPEPAAPKPA